MDTKKLLLWINRRTKNWEMIGKDCVYCDRQDKLIYDLKNKLEKDQK